MRHGNGRHVADPSARQHAHAKYGELDCPSRQLPTDETGLDKVSAQLRYSFFVEYNEPFGDAAVFCRLVRARSVEHNKAMSVASNEGWSSIVVGILRQELDSMIRVIYMITQKDRERREQLLSEAVRGKRWKIRDVDGKSVLLSDMEMVRQAEVVEKGWIRNVYKFGCSFIHLSRLHDYMARDPFQGLPAAQRVQIVEFLQRYHGGHLSEESTFAEIISFAPMILAKVSTNLEIHVKKVELWGQEGRA